MKQKLDRILRRKKNRDLVRVFVKRKIWNQKRRTEYMGREEEDSRFRVFVG